MQRLEEITGIENLISDPELGSGGVHRSTRGGYLNIHADFTVHPYKKNWHRRVNVLVYLNEFWDEKWGQLELWDKNMESCIQKISLFLIDALFLILMKIPSMDILNQ